MKSNPYDQICFLLEEQKDALFAYILFLVRHRADAEDIFQKTALVIIKKAESGVIVENFRAWSREIAYRTVLGHRKKIRNQTRILSEDVALAIGDSFGRLSNSEAAEDLLAIVRECVGELPEQQQLLLNMHYEEGLSQAEIGRRVSKTTEAVQVALSRIRLRLLHCAKAKQDVQQLSYYEELVRYPRQ